MSRGFRVELPEGTQEDLRQSFEVRRLRWLLFPTPIVLLLNLLALLHDAAQDQARRSSLNKAIAITAAPPLLLMTGILLRPRPQPHPVSSAGHGILLGKAKQECEKGST